MDNLNIIAIILAGITTGGLGCFAVQGGLLTSLIAHNKPVSDYKNLFLIVLSFVLAKIVSYTLLGALFGYFGSLFSFSPTTQGWIQIIVAVYMVGVALQLLNIHPIFRYFIIQPPLSLKRLIRSVAKGKDELASPIFLGLLTIFIPCGTTLAIEALAISTGNAIYGSVVMFTYTLFSSWVFFAAVFAFSKLNDDIQKYFYKITAGLLTFLAVLSFNGGLNLLGAPYTLSNLDSIFKNDPSVLSATNEIYNKKKIPADFDIVQRVVIDVRSNGYKSNTIYLKKGIPVLLTLKTENTYSCANAFSMPTMSIQEILPANGEVTIRFTPEKSGQLPYTCSMGMYRGNFVVI